MSAPIEDLQLRATFFQQELEGKDSIIVGWNHSADDFFLMIRTFFTIPVLVREVQEGHPPNYTFLIVRDKYFS
jgi:hypothetical protein